MNKRRANSSKPAGVTKKRRSQHLSVPHAGGKRKPDLARLIRIKWPQLNITITAVMNDAINRSLNDILFDYLPYSSLQNHALVSGDHLYHLVPTEKLIYTSPEFKVTNRVTEPDGTVFLSGLQHLALKYGPLTEYLPAAPCGMVIPEHMSKLRDAGERIWKAHTAQQKGPPIQVIVWDATQPEPKTDLRIPLERIGISENIKKLVKDIHEETNKFWCSSVPDISAVHCGTTTSGAGSKGNFFSTMVFINGEIRPLGYNILNNILKIAVTQPSFGLDHLVLLFKTFASIPSEFVGYAGAIYLFETYRKIDQILMNGEVGKEDFVALIAAFAKYVNLLNAQNLHLFPWKHFREYPISRPDSATADATFESKVENTHARLALQTAYPRITTLRGGRTRTAR